MSDKQRTNSASRASCVAVVVAVALVVNLKLSAQTIENSSARTFVSQFYSWYVPMALQESVKPTSIIAIDRKGEEFAPSLVRLLRADWAAQEECEDLVGLDFDPFLGSQDPAQRYEVGEISKEGRTYRAAIYSMQAGQRGSKPDVLASFARNNGRWRFINFYYPDGGDLVTMLMAPKLPCSSPSTAHK